MIVVPFNTHLGSGERNVLYTGGEGAGRELPGHPPPLHLPHHHQPHQPVLREIIRHSSKYVGHTLKI